MTQTLPHPTRHDGTRIAFFADAAARIVDGKAIVDYIASDDSEDRYGSVIDPQGWETEAFLRGGGPILWAHNHTIPPVGKTLSLTKTKSALRVRVQFAVEQSPFAREVFALVRDGYCPGVSVGFLPKTSAPYVSQTVPRGEDTKYTRAELLEISVVPIPANRNALKLAFASGKLSAQTVDTLRLRSFLEGGPPLSRHEPEWQPSLRTIALMEAFFQRQRIEEAARRWKP